MIRARVKTDLRRIKKLRRDIQTKEGSVKEVQNSWADLYRAFIVKRFTLFSLGGGNWPPIKNSTAKRKGHRRILIDTRFLRLKLSAIIDVIRVTSRSMVFGFRSSIHHPTANMPLVDLAEIHHQGLGNNPERKILVELDDETAKNMKLDAKKRFTETLRG